MAERVVCRILRPSLRRRYVWPLERMGEEGSLACTEARRAAQGFKSHIRGTCPCPFTWRQARQRFKVTAVTASCHYLSPAYQTLTGPSISIPEPLPPNTLLPDSCAAVLNSTHQTEGRGSGQTRFCYVAPVYIRERHSGGQFCHTKGNCKLEE